MGLDQSIFTTSKAIAKAIYEGNTPNGKWSTACFSPRNLEGKNEWTAFDTYAQSRLTQWGVDGEPEISIPGLEGLGLTLTLQEETVSEERRAKTLDVIKDLATIGECTIGLAGIDVNLYQVGLFRKFGFLNYALEGMTEHNFESDEMVGVNANNLALVRYICQRALADSVLDEYEQVQAREFVDFADLVLSYPEAQDALFFYNPWW